MDHEQLEAARPLLRRAASPRGDGWIGGVRAPSPGWEYVTFDAYRLRPGQTIVRAADRLERLVLVLEGRAAVCAGDEDFGVVIEVLNGVNVAVERAMYWRSGGVDFAGGTNATAVRVP